MKYKNLGRSGLSVSRLCLGTMNFGPETDESTSHSIMDSAMAHGINFFDTANRYGGLKPGWTEEIIGRWFAQGGGRREKVVLATKLYGEMDYIDLYQMHHIDRTTPWEEIWQAMEVLVAQGKIMYVGSSNFGGWHLAQAQAAASARHFMGLISEQSIYNLVRRDIEREVIPAAQHYGIGILPWSPLHGGLLGGVLKKDRDSKRRLEGRAKEALDKVRDRVEAYETYCEEIGHEPGEVALAWLMHQPAVAAPIVGPRTQEQLDSSLRAVDIELTSDQLAKLDEIFPGYKTSPEDHAW
jgi:aryl-alcohol dehydrogenase-like predicted oxidoreductase